METRSIQEPITLENVRLLTLRKGTFKFYAELNHKKRMSDARRDRRQLREELHRRQASN